MLISGRSFAKTESYRDSLAGPFTVGQNFSCQDPNYAVSAVVNKSVQNTVALKVLDNVLINTTFTYTLSLTITYYTYTSPAAPVSVNTSLTVNYVAGQGITYKGLDVYTFQGAYKITVTVTGINLNGGAAPPTGTVQLMSEVAAIKTYSFVQAQSIGATFTKADNGKQMQVAWAAVQGAEEYDVEWTTINTGNSNFAVIAANINSPSSPDIPAVSTALAQAFSNNSSRITQKSTSCSLSLLSTDSIFLVRIRQAQYNTSGVRITGNWDYKNATKYAIWLLNWNEQNQNWQYSAAFAEDGKKKEVISYFDGTLRGRQTVTLNNSDNVAIAQENIYDYFGRPSASILPAPYKEPSLNPYLHYIPLFNEISANKPYTFANVAGTTAAACELNPDALSTLSGAARYYSSQNDFKALNINNNYIPDAAGFPLSVTQYTNDNTGRIKSQGGVGVAFQPGKAGSPDSSKTTKYYYGKPEQWELDQLFANDAGYAEHYLKNMVIDPNGQISISYLNASGKTVATALSGASPSNMDPLPTYTAPISQNIHILKPEQFIYDASALKLTAHTTYLASVTGTETLNFSIEQLIDYYPGGAFQICSNCYYKMTVKVTDDCGNIKASISTPVKIGADTSNCSGAGIYNGSLGVPVTRVGEYNVTIEFAFDNTVIQSFADNFITKSVQTGYLEQQFDYIKKRYLDSLDVSSCYSDCHTCTATLGGRTGFVQMLTNKCIALGLDPVAVGGPSFSAWANKLYTTDSTQCRASQANCSYSPCDAINNVMLDDVSPGGQYALFDNNGNAIEPTINVLTEVLPGSTTYNWRVVFPIYPPSNSIYQSNLITLPDGTTTSPNDATFTIQNLITYWQPAWATSFLPYHPEYCKLQYCQANATYESWDMVVQQDINTAAQVPNIPVSGGPPLSYSYTNASDWLLNGDPFFKTGAPGHSYLSQMQSDLLNYSKNVLAFPDTVPVKGLMKFVDYVLYCQDSTATTNTSATKPAWTNCSPNNTCRVSDREWLTYRQYYFDLKQKYYTILQNASCGGGSNCPVGQPITSSMAGTLPTITEFSVHTYTGSCAAGQQMVLVTHDPGTLTQPVTVTIYYPSGPSNILLTFPAGTSQQTLCIPSAVQVSTVYVNAVYAGTAPFGNDPTFVVHITDQAGSSLHNDCGNATFTTRNTLISLTDSHGNPVLAASPVTTLINYNYTTCNDPVNQLVFSQGVTIPAGQSASAPFEYVSNVSCDVPGCHWGTKTITISCAKSLTNASNVTGLATCTGYVVSNPQPPGPGTCPAAYTIKTPRFPDATVNLGTLPTRLIDSGKITGPQRDAIVQQAKDICAGTASAWITRLQPGLTAINATQSQITQLTDAFISICQAGGNETHPMGATTLPPGQTLPYVGFGAAIKSILQSKLPGGNFTTSVNPWLIDAPYPYLAQPQATAKTISNSNASLCAALNTLNNQAIAAGQTLYNYLVSTYGSAMTLSSTDLTNLQNSCGNCKFILAADVTLPVFLDPGSKGWITASDYQAAKTLLASQFTSLPTTDPNYQTIYSNFMNQQWGFALTFDNYSAYDALLLTNPSAILCNTLPYTTTNADPYDCVENAVAIAVNGGLADYDAYIATNRQLFIASYINTCKLAKANANLVGLQQNYHYTLYYYDQADNLVRTIPPEGVALVDPGLFGYIDHARDNDTAAYSYTYNGPTTASNLTTALTTLSTTLSASQGAVEMWLYNNSTNHYHWVEATPDRKYLFNVALAGNNLSIDVLPMVQPTGASVQLVPISGHYQADISALQPLTPFVHIVFQGSSLGQNTSQPQIYLNGTKLTISNNPAPSPYGFTITAGASSVTFPDSIQSLKHLRLYTTLLSQAIITANANNAFFNATYAGYAGWYRFNVPAPGTPPTTINSTTSDETNIINTYPSHALPTTYAYNGTNQVTQQYSPDGGNNRFWYDLLSRLVISQNDKQQPGSNYSFTTYDIIGRITEVGQKNQTSVNIGSPDYLTASTIANFTAAGTNSQITHTYYDTPVPTVPGNTNGIATLPGQSYLRKRVAASTYTETQGSPVLRATYYNYDLDGNVKTLWQQTDGLYVNSTNTGLKRIDYEYDLVSGKVNFVRYQDGQPDAFYYKYNYDADNRLTAALSSTVAMVDTSFGSHMPYSIRKLDARYYYYLHGPLRRQELGGNGAAVQGIDYAYTLQGWLKGVNSTATTAAADMGLDGADVSHSVAKDAYGYNLYYYNTDYTPIVTTKLPFATTLQTNGMLRQLYNGNIAASSVNIPQLTGAAYWIDRTYGYDQLNRIKSAIAYHTVTTTSTPVHNGDYDELFTYDGNGNILTVKRAGSGTGALKDSMTYVYQRNSAGKLYHNKLNYLNGHAAASNITPDQLANNYTYDPIGNLIADVQSGITAIGWSVYGKITNINKASGNITYTYNPAGQRVSKTVAGLTTYYIRDAQGNTLAVYDNAASAINWREQHLYGTSRLGMWTPNVTLTTANGLGVWDTTGRKQYELTNHLGNVLETITDKRLQHTSNSSTIDYYTADIGTAQDYYSFGSLMPARTYDFTPNNNYRYGFNGKENDNDVGKGIGNQQDYGMRIYDPRVGRFLSVDPIATQYPELSTYQFASNSPIKFRDLDGLEAGPDEYLMLAEPPGANKQEISKYRQENPVLKFAVGFAKTLANAFGALTEIPGQMHYGDRIKAENQSEAFPLTHGQNFKTLAEGVITAPFVAVATVAKDPKDPFKWGQLAATAVLYRGVFTGKPTTTSAGDVVDVNPAELWWTQNTAGGRGRAALYREQMSSGNYNFDPIDVVKYDHALVTLDHTRAAIALEKNFKSIPARIHNPNDPLPLEMIKEKRFGDAKTWGEAVIYRASNQIPPLPATGTKTPPRLPKN
jgi:RHS repeat-associated protein